MIRHAVLHVGRLLATRWPLATAGAAVVFVVAVVAVTRIGSRRDAAMQSAAAAATAAIHDARAAEAMTWAPDELVAAESRLREALSALRVEQARLWPVPDSARIIAASAAAERAARQALALARDRHATAATTTASLIEDAKAAVAAADGLASAIHLDAGRRALLASARLALTEARIYQQEGDLGRATVCARESVDLTGQLRSHAAAVAARYADAQTLARWRSWKEETIDWSRREKRAAIVIAKEPHRLTLFVRGQPAKTYRVDLGFNWIADKSRAGDGATPEGRYRVVARKATSTFYKALLLDYPNAEDRAEFDRARRDATLPRAAGIGGLIEIHGEGGRGRDWTRGCVALTNAELDELFALVSVGTPVTIVGSDDFGAIAEFAIRHRDGVTAGERDAGAGRRR